MTIKKKTLPLGVAIGIGLNSMAAMGAGFTQPVSMESKYNMNLLLDTQDDAMEIVEKANEFLAKYDFELSSVKKGIIISEVNILKSAINQYRDNGIDIYESIENIERHIEIVESLIAIEEEENNYDIYEELLRIHTEELGELETIHRSLENGFYTEESWEELERVMDYSETILEDFENQVRLERSKFEMAVEGLRNAISNLEEKDYSAEEDLSDINKLELRSRYEAARSAIDFSLIREMDLVRFYELEEEINLALESNDLTREKANLLILQIETLGLNLEDYTNYLNRLHNVIAYFNLKDLEGQELQSFTEEHDRFGILMNELSQLEVRDESLGSEINSQIDKIDAIIKSKNEKEELMFKKLVDEFKLLDLKVDRALNKADKYSMSKTSIDGIVRNMEDASIAIDTKDSYLLNNAIVSILSELEGLSVDLNQNFRQVLFQEYKTIYGELLRLNSHGEFEEDYLDIETFYNNENKIWNENDIFQITFDLNERTYNEIEKLRAALDNTLEASIDEKILEKINSIDRSNEEEFQELISKLILEKSLDLEIDENVVLGLNRYGKKTYDSIDDFIVDLNDKVNKKNLMGSLRNIGAITSNRDKYEFDRTERLVKLHDEAVFILRNINSIDEIRSKDLEIRLLIEDIYSDRAIKIREMKENFSSFENILENRSQYIENDQFRRLENLFNERMGLELGSLKDIENVNANFNDLFNGLELKKSENISNLQEKFYNIVEKNLHIIDMTEEEQGKYTEESFNKIIELYEELEDIFENRLGEFREETLDRLISEFETSIANLDLRENKKDLEEELRISEIERLKLSISKAKTILEKGENYTLESRLILEGKISEAENMIENSKDFNTYAIEDMWKSLDRELEQGLEKVDLEEFNELLLEMEEYINIIENNNIYTEKSSEKLMDAYDMLDELINGSKIYSREELSNAKEVVIKAINSLEIRPVLKPETRPENKPDIKPNKKPDTGNNYGYEDYDWGNNKDNGNNSNKLKPKKEKKVKANNSNNKKHNKNQVKVEELKNILKKNNDISDDSQKSMSVISNLSNSFNGIQNSMSKVMVKTFNKVKIKK